ncbi:hypothetical protein [Flavobacterium limnophilum]|uniref:hypothetical protein n=1 Tax=Flavobacterium limnophilum TaxID=3003262 RepID=UPI0022AC3E8F|nr:hypothetical protein [Flavobacterium limnophilum]
MKKILGILGVAVIAATMFFSTNNVNGSSSDASLASLITLNTANAQNSEEPCEKAGTTVRGNNILYYLAASGSDCCDGDRVCGESRDCLSKDNPIAPLNMSSECTPVLCK